MNHEEMQAKATVRPVKERIEDELLKIPGVTAVDIAFKETDGKKTDQMAIVVHVREKKPKRALKAGETIPAEIDGIPTDVIEEDIVPFPQMMAVADLAPFIDAAAYATLSGGMSIGPCRSIYKTPPEVPAAGYYVFVGTLGVMVTDRVTGAHMALTNFHVAAVDTGWAVGNTMTQPSLVDGGACPAGDFGTLTRAQLTDQVDGAVISINAGKATECSILQIGDVAGTVAPTQGPIRKRGRTTELTYGTVISTDVTLSLDYGDGIGTRTLRHQIRIEADPAHNVSFGKGGDSGSVIVDDQRRVMGLYFAGNRATATVPEGKFGYANPIQVVLDTLNVDMCTAGPTPVFSKPFIVCGGVQSRIIACDFVTKLKVSCYDWKSKLIACDVVTKPLISCLDIQSRLIVCDVVSRPKYKCVQPSKLIVCDLVTTAVACDLTTKVRIVCEGVATGPGCDPTTWPQDRNPFERYGGGAQSNDDQLSEAYLQGYLTALAELTDDDSDS